jgi:hypothetical protein
MTRTTRTPMLTGLFLAVPAEVVFGALGQKAGDTLTLAGRTSLLAQEVKNGTYE